VKAAVDAEHLQLIRTLGLRSSMVVPLRCRGRTLGVMSFVSAESGRLFDATDLALAEELASIAALAVDNARLYREAQDANRAKDEFLATVSHELRTPLNAMLGWASLLRTRTLAEDKRLSALETIERNARAQSQLIEDLLDVSRIISGNLRLEPRAVDLATLIEAAMEAVRLAADARGVQLHALIDEEARPATGDPVRLQQVIWNLLSNAVKFTDRGGTVTVRLQRLESQAVIRVTDTGRGIDGAFLPHIFERFKQAQGTTTRSHGGLGLGLAIVKHLVELHGGSVTAASAGLQQGSSFHVNLPLAAVQLRGAAPMTMTAAPVIAPRLDGLRVLVVVDEADARDLPVAALAGRGAEVTTASSAADAGRHLAMNAPDVLVSDIGMPEEDGYSLIRKVRRELKMSPASLPAIALTAYARTEDRTRAILAGFQAHVAKPVEPDELVIVVAGLGGRTWASPDSEPLLPIE
jgi:signal transduction histidine kinase/ActR/RegA family two-component response regulator